MHRCLRITEILHLIIGYLVDEEVTSANVTTAIRHKDVASLARTCKAFMDPALDVLWRTQSSLSPLVMCLPAHFWFLKTFWRGTVVSLVHEPSHEDWLMLKRYSRRIRAFDRTTLQLPTVSRNIVDSVFSPDLSDELFPRLHTLNVDILSKPPPNPILLLGHIRLPHLVRLRFNMPRFYRHRDPVLYLTLACVPSLQALKISASRARLDVSTRLAVNFSGVPHLRTLYLSHYLLLLPSSLRELSHLQYLCELTVTLPDDVDVDVCPSVQPTFPSLQRIAITVGFLSQCTNLLSSIASRELGSVKIFYRSPPTQNDIYELFREIEHICQCYADFNTLDIQCSNRTQLIPHLPFDLPRSMLRPFLACHRLRVLDLTSLGTLDIDDSFIAQITPAWPVIKILHLRASQRNDGCVTLEGIRGLLRGCPRLQSLHMQVDARILPEGEPEMQSLSLARLDVSGSRMEDETAVERYLKTLAPQLEWLKMKPPSPDVSM
ncbi:hypothetical protein EDD16DRAFT_1702251 [Pisolithus croceorrhizus]|nr:hypothetical protein EV401DRAFT_2073769 [Pisolithus croceorrhizus]KAI6127920.1 hypothetical protein EDD16DRAFT_1702251 [Pisolithus croceorrhizus]KAI6158527.1 hypothetical protein EDD17DRAFT_1763675 [Pisolithus thermaeus]